MLAGIDDIAVTAYRNMKRRSMRTFNRKKIKAFWLASMSEQAPNPSSQVTLSAEEISLTCIARNWLAVAIHRYPKCE
jgi:hypothetical protein